MLAADGKLFVVSADGRIYCFGEKTTKAAVHHEADPSGSREHAAASDTAREIEQILATTKIRHGYALICAGESNASEKGDFVTAQVDTLLKQTEFSVVVTDSDARRLNALRHQYRHDRERICLLSQASGKLDLPPYFASIVIGSSNRPLTIADLQVLRPNGGVACLSVPPAAHEQLEQSLRATRDQGFTIERLDDMTVIRRGALPGAANYTGDWSSPDELVRAPLGVLWFDDTLGHFKRSPQPWFVDGVMISYPKDWMAIHRENRRPPYDLLPPVYSDVYTGRVISADETAVADLEFPRRDLKQSQPNQYRPPTQRDAWKPEQPVVGQRVNPLTGEQEPRAIPKSYGCDGGVDYGHIYTMRSGTPAFYDKRLESGVCSISGPRSGCTNSIIPAGGVLNVPFFYEGCTCSYPLPVGLALIPMPPRHEQWSSWGPGKAENIRRVGINFGAPGDRMTEDGTLWLDHPNRGGPSPEVVVNIEPKTAEFFYQHSLFVEDESSQPWVAGSGVQGVEAVTVSGLKPTAFTVRLFFLDPDYDEPGQRVFDVGVNGSTVIENLDIAKESGGRMRSLMRQFDGIESTGELRIVLTSRTGSTILCGIELAEQRLPLN